MFPPDVNLPPKSPTESYHHESHNCDKLAVYTLVDLGINGIHDLLKSLENNDENLRDTYRLPLKYDFEGASLKDVYDYHLKLGSEKSHHPTLFIVAYSPDYEQNGVLLVNLDTDLECSVDTCRMNVSEALLAAVNLMIANMDWEDFKEDELPLPPTKRASAPEKPSGPERPSQSVSPHHVFGMYTTAGADMTDIRALVEPDWRDKSPGTHVCESIGSYTDYPDPWNQLIKHHPWNCRRNPRLHRQWFICADRQDYREHGVLLVHIDWDGNIDIDPDELLKIGETADVMTERSTVKNTIATLNIRVVERK